MPHASYAQLVAGPGVTDLSPSQPISNRTFSFSGTIPGQVDGALSLTFSIYPDQQSATTLWTETQIVQVTAEKYSVMLGSTSATGLPSEIFSADQSHWLGVQVNGTEKRFLLVSVPYAMKAVNADQLGGLPFSEYVTAQQLQAALQGAPTGTVPQPKTTTTTPTGQAAAAGTPPQPATDFTDNNTSEVLLVTQQGTGYAIHAITSSQAEAILAQNDSIGGTALHALATNPAASQTGPAIGVLAEVASPDGIAGEFNNRAGGKILSLRNNGVEVGSVDSNGNVNASGQVQATTFSGSGSALFGIPQSAINATPFNNPFSVVARDSNGSFAANQVTATTFSGGGFGLFGIPPSAINATPFNNPFSVVQRDANGGFAAGNLQVTGNLQVMNQLTSSGFVDFSGAVTAPVRTVLTANIPSLCFSSKELLLVTDAFPGQQLFVCNSNGNGWVLLGDGGGSAGSSNVSGNTTGTLENVSQLGSGTGLTVSSTSGTAVSASSTSGMAIHGDSTSVGVQGSSQGGIGVWAAATANDSTGTALLLSHASQGKLIDGGVSLGAGTDIFETFSVTAEGDVTFNGGMMTPFETTGTWVASSLVKLTSISGNFGAGTVTMTSPGDTSGVIGIISGLPASGSRIQVVQSGQFSCNFDGPATSGHYVGISKTTAGDCADIGATFPTDGQQVVGRVLSSFAPGTGRVLLFQSELHSAAGGSAVTINTGDGLTGGPITSSGTISVADRGVTAAKLAPNAVTSASIADNSIPPGKIAGTAATLGNNNFIGTQTMSGLNVNGFVSLEGSSNSFIGISNSFGTALQAQGGNVTDGAIVARSTFRAIDTSSTFGYGLFSFSPNGVGVYANGGDTGVQAQTVSGTALAATVNNQDTTIGTAGSFTVLGSGTILSGRSGAQQTEVFNVDTSGNLLSKGNFLSFGSLTTQYPNSPTGTILNSLVKLTPNGFAVSTSAGDSGGAIGIAIAGAGTTGNVQIAYAGRVMCQFDNNPGAGDYV
ncbi:MAG TPA: hypothetical protein VE176_14405, partial [Candidatus Limnocylindrales bacterium]|nr:hypothetical protein [Candidatus Limnocylindrales bacterium]